MSKVAKENITNVEDSGKCLPPEKKQDVKQKLMDNVQSDLNQ